MKEEYKYKEERLRSNDRLLQNVLQKRQQHLPPMNGIEEEIMKRIAPRHRRLFWLYSVSAVAAVVVIGVLIFTNVFKKEYVNKDDATVTTSLNVPIQQKDTAKVFSKAENLSNINNRKCDMVNSRKSNILRTKRLHRRERRVASKEIQESKSFYASPTPADPETMFIMTSADNNVLSTNRERMTAQMELNSNY